MYYIALSQGAAHEVYLDGSDSKSGKLARTRQVAGQKQEHRKDLLQDRSARIRATLQVAPFCEVNIVYSPLLARRRCRRSPTGTAGAPTGGGSVAGPGPVAAPSPGSYPGHHPLTCPYGSDARTKLPPSCMSIRLRRPWAKLPPSCMSVRHRRPWAKSPLEFRTPPAENRAQCFHSQV